MSSFILNLAGVLKFITAVFERNIQLFFTATTRDDVKEKIKALNEERDRIYIRHNYFKSINRLKELGVAIEPLEVINVEGLSKEEMVKIYSNFEAINSMLEKEQESAYINKNETVVNLFLLNEKKKYFKCKVIAVFILILSAVSIVFINIPYWSVIIGFVLYILFEAKDQVVSYRVARGFFGTTTNEAIELIKFIRENIDDINSGDDGGSGRKILNPIKDDTANDALTSGELPNV